MRKMTKERKQEMVQALATKLDTSVISVLGNFSGLSVREMERLRALMREQRAGLAVVKNTFLGRACKGLEREDLCAGLTGPIFLVWTREGDEVGVVKSLLAFQKTAGKIELRVALLRGEVLNADGVAGLGRLPGSREVKACIVTMIRMPALRIVSAVNSPMARLVSILRQLKETKETQDGKES